MNLLHNIEDAALFHQDLYAAYFDFSSAFNMIDHQKLLCIMHSLGYTHDTIDTIKGIYTNSTTHILLNNTPGSPIPITRGTIQGDTLSPLLFIIFLEPLHIWLRSGGRGYRAASLPSKTADEHHTSSLGYADDTAVLTGSSEDLRIQCDYEADSIGDLEGNQWIREAMTSPDSSAPAPPARLLHLTYGSQYKALHITSWRGKRSYNDDKLVTSTVVNVQWAPTIMHNEQSTPTHTWDTASTTAHLLPPLPPPYIGNPNLTMRLTLLNFWDDQHTTN
eukprot:gene5139-biopygen15431